MITPVLLRPEDDPFFAGTYSRLVRTMIITAAAFAPVVWFRYQRGMAIGFVAGSLTALINFYWLKKTVLALDPMRDELKRTSRAEVVARFLLRYALIAITAYVIFKSSAASIYGLFAGLLLPVAAIFVEAVYQTMSGIRKQS